VDLASPIHRISGAAQETVRPLESIVKNTFAMLHLAAKNDVAKSLIRLAKNFEGSGRWVEPVPTPMGAIKVQIGEVVRTLRGMGVDLPEDVLEKVATIFRPRGLRARDAAENVVTVWERGRPRYYQLDPDLYRAVTFMDKDTSNALVQLLSFPAKVLRAGAVLAPEFIGRNPVRDQIMAAIQSKTGYTPGVDFFRGLFHLANPKAGFSPDRLYANWLSTGGAQAAMVSLDRNVLHNVLQEIVGRPSLLKEAGAIATPQEAAQFAARLLGRAIEGTLEPLRRVSETMEVATRLGEYERALKQPLKPGQSPFDRVLEAALRSRDVTLDFSRFGDVGQNLNKVAAFWNAGMQGLDKIKRTFAEDPVGATARATMYITLPTVILYMANRDDPRYQTAPRWLRDTFWMVDPVRMATGGRRQMPVPLWIPKPFELGIIFGSIPERLLEWIDSQDPQALKNGLAGSLWKAVDNMVLPIPTAVRPVFELLANYSLWQERPIVPRSEEQLPSRLQYGPYTSTTARGLGAVTGLSPRKIEAAVTGYGGGLGRLALEMPEWLTGGRREDIRVGAERIPLVRGFTRAPYAMSQDIEDFYNELGRLEGEVQAARMEGRLPPSRPRFLSGPRQVVYTPDTVRLGYMTRIRDALAAGRQAMERLLQSDLPAEDKRRQVEAVQLHMIGLARQALGRPPLGETPRGLSRLLPALSR
jgi:hypothetical protein